MTRLPECQEHESASWHFFCGFFVNLIKKSLTTRFGGRESILAVKTSYLRKKDRLSCFVKKPSAEFSRPRRENQAKSVFPGDMRIGKNTSQPASVESGRPLTRFCMQRAASPRKNACIFEKRVELVRHAKYPGPANPVRGILYNEISGHACGPPQQRPDKQHRRRGSERAPSPGSHLRSEAHPPASE